MMINPRILGVAYFGDKAMFFRAGIRFFGQEMPQFIAFGCDLWWTKLEMKAQLVPEISGRPNHTYDLTPADGQVIVKVLAS